jgi:hypothetical protein
MALVSIRSFVHQSLDLGSFSGIVIVARVELDGAVEVGEGLLVAAHQPVSLAAASDDPGHGREGDDLPVLGVGDVAQERERANIS